MMWWVKCLLHSMITLIWFCAPAVGRLCRLRSKGHSHFKWREEHAEMIILKERPKIGWGHSRAVLNFAK